MTTLRFSRAFSTALLAAGICAIGSGADIRLPSDGVTRTSRPVRLLRTWEEAIKVNGRDSARRVRILFDYSRGVALEESYDRRGVLRASRTITQAMPAPSAEEIAEAFRLTRAASELESIFGRFSVVLEGGFLLEEESGKPCGPGSRCLHVFLLSADRAGLIRRVVVDLGSRRIVYPLYTPPEPETHGR